VVYRGFEQEYQVPRAHSHFRPLQFAMGAKDVDVLERRINELCYAERYRDAESILRELLDRLREVTHPDERRIMRTLHNLAGALFHQSKLVSVPAGNDSALDSAAAVLRTLLQMQVSLLWPWHEDVWQTKTDLDAVERDRCISSIIRDEDTFHGIRVFGRGVFTIEDRNDGLVRTYAGQCKDGYACGLGVLTWSDGTKIYAENGPDGKCDGRYLRRYSGGTTEYRLWELCGNHKAYAYVFADGRCKYGDKGKYIDGACAPDDPRLLALRALVAPVEVCPAAPAPPPPSVPTRPQASVRWISRRVVPPAGAREDRGHRGASPRRTPSLAVRHNPTINRTATHDHAVMRARTVLA